MSQSITYHPAIFDVTSMRDAMQIILTPEDSTTEHRWATETPYLVDLMTALRESAVVAARKPRKTNAVPRGAKKAMTRRKAG